MAETKTVKEVRFVLVGGETISETLEASDEMFHEDDACWLKLIREGDVYLYRIPERNVLYQLELVRTVPVEVADAPPSRSTPQPGYSAASRRSLHGKTGIVAINAPLDVRWPGEG